MGNDDANGPVYGNNEPDSDEYEGYGGRRAGFGGGFGWGENSDFEDEQDEEDMDDEDGSGYNCFYPCM